MMNTSPVLSNILLLAKPETWQKSVNLGEQTLTAWIGRIAAREIERVIFVGCGTSYYAGQVGKYIIEGIAHIPAEAIQAFAFATYTDPAVLGPRVLVVGISTTGESEAVRDALEMANRCGAISLAITANATSSVARVAGGVMLSGGDEDRVLVKTVSYVQSLIGIYLLGLALAEARGADGRELRDYWHAQIARAAEGARRFLESQQPEIERLVQIYGQVSKVFVIGSGPNAGTTQEAALKIIEMAKMFAEAQELEDFLHGRFREVDQINPMFFIAPQGRLSQRVLDFLTINHHIRTPSVVLTDRVTPGIKQLATQIVQMPVELDELATPLIYITPMHLFAHHMALHRGWDPLSRRYEDIVPQKVRYSGP